MKRTEGAPTSAVDVRALLLLAVLTGCPDAPSSPIGSITGTAVAAPGHTSIAVAVRLLSGTPESVEKPGEPLMLSELTHPVTLSPTLAAELDGGTLASRTTSSSGAFEFSDVAPGTYHLVLDATDVGSFYGPVRVVVPAVRVRRGRATSVGNIQLVNRRNPLDLHDGHETY